MTEEFDFDDPLHPRRAIELRGQPEGEAAFLAAWASGRLAHAWLISGPRGIGKATLAFRIARFVLAGGRSGGGDLFGDAAPTLEMDPGQPIFRRVASGGHADFAYVERGWSDDSKPKRKAEISVEQVRGIGGFLSLTPAEGAWRVVLVDAVDEMSRSAANAILKVLEEPPRNALLLLLAHSPGRILPTIRSRCRRLPLRPLDDRIVAGLLGRLRPAVTPSDALSIARLSEGSVGRAIDLADEGGLTLYRDMVALLSGLPRLDHQALHTFGDRVAKDEAVFRTTMTLFLWWLTRGAGAWAARPQPDQETQREVLDGEFTLQRRLVTAAGLDRWVEVWEKTTHLFDRAEAVNLDRKQVVLNAFFALERLGHR